MKPIDINRQNNIQKALPGGAEVPKLVFETLKPLRAACVENDYMFMAYLIEMIEVEAYQHMSAKQDTSLLSGLN